MTGGKKGERRNTARGQARAKGSRSLYKNGKHHVAVGILMMVVSKEKQFSARGVLGEWGYEI